MKAAIAAILLCLAPALVGCGGDDSSPDAAATQATSSSGGDEETAPPKSISFKVGGKTVKRTEPEVEVPEGRPPNKLIVEDMIEGSGHSVEDGDELKVQFVVEGYLNDELGESSWDYPKPFTFELGSGEAILGWEKGLPGMRVGGRRYLVVPGQLSAPNGISPFQNPEEYALVYVIDLLEAS